MSKSIDTSPGIRQRGSLAGIKPAPGLLEKARGIAEDQRPCLGAQIVEMDVVVGGQAVAAEGVQRLRDGAGRAYRQFHQAVSEISAPASGRVIGDIADRLPGQIFAAIHIADEIRERMRDALISSDGLPEGDALAGIGCGQPDRLARQTRPAPRP